MLILDEMYKPLLLKGKDRFSFQGQQLGISKLTSHYYHHQFQ